MNKEKIIERIKNLENPYPKDIFVWDNPEKCDFTRGRFNQFIYQVVENTKRDIIDLIEEIDKESGNTGVSRTEIDFDYKKKKEGGKK